MPVIAALSRAPANAFSGLPLQVTGWAASGTMLPTTLALVATSFS